MDDVLRVLMVVSGGLGVLWLSDWKGVSLVLSAGIYWPAYAHHSYLACFLNQLINLVVIGALLTQMTVKLQEGLYDLYLTAEGVFRMGSLIVCITCLYFNFSAYQKYKQLAFQSTSTKHDYHMKYLPTLRFYRRLLKTMMNTFDNDYQMFHRTRIEARKKIIEYAHLTDPIQIEEQIFFGEENRDLLQTYVIQGEYRPQGTPRIKVRKTNK